VRRQRPWWRGPVPIIAAVVVVVAVVAGIIVAVNSGGNSMYSDDPLIAKPVAAGVLDKVVNISPPVISQVGADSLVDPLQAISGPALLPTGGKPQVLYIGADFCPYCAADRWSLVNSLSRFGSFSGLEYMRSSLTDLDLATFTFHSATYSSKYVNFVAVENEDRDHNPQDSMTSQQTTLLSTLGNNGYPFLDIDGKYANDAKGAYPGGYDQSLLSGLTWDQVSAKLSNPSDPLTQGIVASANYVTAAICKVTNNQPSSACGNATIRHIEQILPKK
jgi:hypothetical protein